MAGVILMTCALLTAVDGDTVKCDGTNLRPIGNGAPHESGFDTPETGGRADCLAERMLADLAKQRMSELIETPGLQIENSGQLDTFDRPLVWLRLPDGTTVGQRMIDEGYAQEWLPGKAVEWCTEDDEAS